MLARGARLTALEPYLSTEREHFWQREFEITLTAPKLSLVGFSAEYKGAVLSTNHLRLSFSAEVSQLLHCVGKAQLHERCWSHVMEEPQIIVVHMIADCEAELETVQELCPHPNVCCLPRPCGNGPFSFPFAEGFPMQYRQDLGSVGENGWGTE